MMFTRVGIIRLLPAVKPKFNYMSNQRSRQHRSMFFTILADILIHQKLGANPLKKFTDPRGFKRLMRINPENMPKCGG